MSQKIIKQCYFYGQFCKVTIHAAVDNIYFVHYDTNDLGGVVIVDGRGTCETDGISADSITINTPTHPAVGLILCEDESADIYLFKGNHKPIIIIEGEVVPVENVLSEYIQYNNGPRPDIIDRYLEMLQNPQHLKLK